MKVLIFSFLLLTFWGCQKEEETSTPKGPGVITEGQNPTLDNCICPKMYSPVCGEDGNTYGNHCEAKCAEVEVVSQGECEQ